MTQEATIPTNKVIVGLLILLLGAAIIKFADLPTRMSVVEVRTSGIEARLASMDAKLDALLGMRR